MTAALTVLEPVPPLEPDRELMFLLTRVRRVSPGTGQGSYPAGIYRSKGDAMAAAALEASLEAGVLTWNPVSDRTWEAFVNREDRFSLYYEIRQFTVGAPPVREEDEQVIFPGHLVPHEDGDCSCF